CTDQRPAIVKKAVLNEGLFVKLLSTAQTLTVSDDATQPPPLYQEEQKQTHTKEPRE
ncbi:hypothetical protein M9458_026278, partial [Cirrhinus mrigala]